MTNQANLTKLQLALLSAAATHPAGSLLPAPADLKVAPNRVRKAAGQLVETSLADERRVEEQSSSWRVDGEALLGAFINAAGRLQVTPAEPEAAPSSTPPSPAPSPARQSKTQMLIDLLRRADGASVAEVMTATGWQAHTARAAITILNSKSGHPVERFGERGSCRYRIVEAG